MTGTHAPHWLVLALCLAPYFLNLGASALWDANEAFYVEGPREMIEAREFITPRFNFADKLNKPILSYWVAIAAFKLFGVSEWAERFATAMCICLSVIMTYLIGLKLYDRRAALFAAVALATSFKFITVGRRSLIDALLTLTAVSAVYFFVCSWQRVERRRIYLVLFYAMMALGVLTKGLLGIILPGGIVGLFILTQPTRHRDCTASSGERPARQTRLLPLAVLILRRRFGLLKEVISLPGMVVFLAIAAPWFAAMTARHGSDYLVSFFVGEHVSRYVHGTFGLKRPFWYYLPTIFGEFAPWSFFLPAAILAAWQRRRSPQSGKDQSAIHNPQSAMESDVFLLLWLGFIFMFFSFSTAKLNEYMLQLYPAAALLVGRLFSESQAFKSKSVGGLVVGFTGLLIVALGFGGWLMVVAAGKLFGAKLVAYAPAAMMAATALALAWTLTRARHSRVTAACRGGPLCPPATSEQDSQAVAARRGRAPRDGRPDSDDGDLKTRPLDDIFSVTAVGAFLLAVSFLLVLPEIEQYRPVRPLAERINREAADGDLVGYYKFTAPSLCYYTRRKIFEVFFAHEMKQLFRSDKRVFSVMAEREYRELAGDGSLPLRALECRASLFPLTMKRFLVLRSPEDLEKVCVVTNR